MQTQWRVYPQCARELSNPIREALTLHPLVADILVRRGVHTPEAAQRFLKPSLEHLHDPFLLKDMAQAVALTAEKIAGGEKIVVSGDYDVDGITSTTLLTEFLQACGAVVEPFIPNRFDHGYGLTRQSVQALLALSPKLVITVDNGITALEEVGWLQKEGVQTIVTDHHILRAEGVPPGLVINPLQPDCPYPFKKISGVGVAFKFITALRKHLRDLGWWADRPEPNLKDSLDLVAIGTVADVVPLVDENRTLVYFGLEVLNRTRPRPGLEALLSLGRQFNGFGEPPDTITPRTIGFQIAPRINAAGRMAEGALGVALLLCREEAQALVLAQRLEEENNNRRTRGEEMFAEAQRLVQAQNRKDPQAGLPVVVVASDLFHEGIVGITASRLADHYNCPAFVLSDNGKEYKGSARAIPGYQLTQALAQCQDLLIQWGGHALAAGFTLEKSSLESFRQRVGEACLAQQQTGAAQTLFLEGRLQPEDISPQLVEQINALGPFGYDNDPPTFLLEQSHLPEKIQVLKERHLKWVLSRQVEMVAWKAAPTFTPSPANQYRVRLGFNDYRGVRKIQLTVEDIHQPGNGGE
ncbi:MAG: single-stranded-DNA-specific exonuclease RecJ [Deltaproteobacteria bacterium]|nr:single-stranded-DNA-specific exonuclease RecJ [Deltaproteobacteria bacterium]